MRIVPLPEPCKDVRDFLEAEGKLADLIAAAAEYSPSYSPVELEPGPEPAPADYDAPIRAAVAVMEESRNHSIPDLRYFPWTDYGNAERLHAVFGDRIRWCHDMQRWLVWNEKRWMVDNQHAMFRLARQTMRYFLAQVPEMDSDLQKAADVFGKKSENRSGLANMVDL